MKPAADSLPPWVLRSEHSGAFLRLQRLVNGRRSFTLCFLTYSDSFYRDEAADFLEGRLGAHVRVAIDPEERIGTEVLFDRLSADPDGGPAQLMGLEFWSEGLDDLLGRLNQRREALAERCPRPLLFWVLSRDLPAVATRAADLWAWRSGVFDFTLPPTGIRTAPNPLRLDGPVVHAADREARIRKLESYLKQRSRLGPTDVDLFLDLGDLQRSLGNVAEAETAYLHAQKGAETLGEQRRQGIAQRKVAEIMQMRGELDDALRMLNEQLPVFKEIGDVRSCALTHTRIAAILQERGQFDDALRILNEQLHVFEKLGDVRSQATTQVRIANVLQDRGQLHEAMQILAQQLPVFEELGDARLRALAQAGIVDVLLAQGQLDDAKRIMTEEQLPVFEQLGDIRSRALIQSRIADVLQVRGQLEDALRTRTEEELPVYEQLGDIRSRAICQGKIADIMEERGQLEDALRIRTEEELPVYERLGDVRSRAITQGEIADILQELGKPEEALRIYEQQVVPGLRALRLTSELNRAQARIEALRSKLV